LVNPLRFCSQDRAFDLTHAIEHLTDGVAVYSMDGECLYANRALTGLAEGEQESSTAVLHFQRLIGNQFVLEDVFQSLKQFGIWHGPYPVNIEIKKLRLVMRTAIALDPECSQFITYFLATGQKSVEADIWDNLRDSEERYQTLVELSPNLIQIHINGITTFINSAGVKMLGGTCADEFIGQSIFKYIHPKEHEFVVKRLTQEITDREKTGPVEERWIRTDGSEFDVEIVALPFEYRGQVAVQVIAIDITEKKQAREQLRQYTRQLLALNAIGLALVSSLNTDDILQQVTQNLTEVLHAKNLSILLKQRQDFVVAASVGQDADKLLNFHFPHTTLEKYIKPTHNGPIVLSGDDIPDHPVFSKNPASIILLERVLHNDSLVGVLQATYPAAVADLSTEQEILYSVSHWVAVALHNSWLYQNERRQLEYSEGLLESASAINSDLDLSQVLERILQQVWRVIPCSAANIMVIDGSEVNLVCSLGYDRYGIHPDWINKIHFPIDSMVHLCSIQTERRPIIIQNTNDDPGWVTIPNNEWIRSYTAAPLIVKDQVYGFLNLDSDQIDYFDEETIQRLQAFAAQASIAIQNAQLVESLQNALHHEQEIRAQLVQSEKLAVMGRMVASVAHELNNPLQTIQNCLYILQEAGDLKPELIEYLNTGSAEVKRLSGIVDQLREAYRPSLQIARVDVNPRDILKNVFRLLKPHLRHKRIKWVITGECDCLINAHVDMIKQVFINLAQNAIDAMEPLGGTLTVRFEKHPDETKAGICFTDTGKGISPEDLSHIFDPFYTTREMGFGIGLSICLDIVENHGGTISVESCLGGGSTFCVWLPIKHSE
jgi:two-component system, NtrC family, sensor kinase